MTDLQPMQDHGGSCSFGSKSLDSPHKCPDGEGGAHPAVDVPAMLSCERALAPQVSAGLMSSVRQALEEGRCDELVSARVLNILEQDSVQRDLENLRILIELARSEKALVATQQALALKEAEVASLNCQVQELELANAALVRRAHQIPAPSSAELHAKLQFAENRVQQLMADYEDKQV